MFLLLFFRLFYLSRVRDFQLEGERVPYLLVLDLRSSMGLKTSKGTYLKSFSLDQWAFGSPCDGIWAGPIFPRGLTLGRHLSFGGSSRTWQEEGESC